MSFHVYETKQTIKAKHRPIFIITSNNEKELPAPFLRRCFFHYIHFPNANELEKIVYAHYPNINQRLLSKALQAFCTLREVDELKKKPSTSELLDWLRLLMLEDFTPEQLAEFTMKDNVPPMIGALLKNEQDMNLMKRFTQLFNL